MSEVNPWVRADLETYNAETLVLIPENMREEYARIMKQLVHYKAIATLVLGELHQVEKERWNFFTYIQEHHNGV